MVLIRSWYEGQDQGGLAIALCLCDRFTGKAVVKQKEQFLATGRPVFAEGHFELWGDFEIAKILEERFNGAEIMINLLSPGGQDQCNPVFMECVKLHSEIRKLQRLVFSNLGCIQPPLEPYKE